MRIEVALARSIEAVALRWAHGWLPLGGVFRGGRSLAEHRLRCESRLLLHGCNLPARHHLERLDLGLRRRRRTLTARGSGHYHDRR